MQTDVTVPHANATEVPTMANVRELSQFTGPCVSIYLDSHQAGTGTGPWNLRLKSMIEACDTTLKNRLVAGSDRADLLDPLRALLSDPELAKGHHSGLAIFRSPRAYTVFRLPWAPPVGCSVEQRFMLLPLLHELNGRERFYLLSLAQHNVKLMECAHSECQSVALPPGTPTHIDEFTALDVQDHRLINSSNAGPDNGATTGSFGTKTVSEKRYLHLNDFCRAIDRSLQKVLAQSGLPLVVAGTDADVSAYISVQTYPNFVDKMVAVGPHSGWTEKEMAAAARNLFGTWISDSERKALGDYERSANLRRTSTELESILRSAWHGRLWHLFLTPGDQPKGDVDRMLGRVPMAGEMAPAVEDLINAAAVETLRHRGSVWVLPSEAVPGKTGFAAAMRF